MPYVDFQAVKDAVSIEDAAHLLGLALKASGAQLRSPCPACKDGGDRALVVTPTKGLFYCFPAKKGGDCIALAAHILGVSQHDAASFLFDQGTVTSTPLGDSTVSKKDATAPQKTEGGANRPNNRQNFGTADRSIPKSGSNFDPAAYLERLDYAHDDLRAIGHPEEVLRQLGIGYSAKGFNKGITIALRWPTGEIAGFGSVDENGRLKLPARLIPPKVVQLKRPA